MRKFSIACATIMCSGSIFAQNSADLPSGFVTVPKNVLCGPSDTVFQALAHKDINEKPIWSGSVDNGSNVAVFVNETTSSFTMIQFGKQMSCILAIGNESYFFPKK